MLAVAAACTYSVYAASAEVVLFMVSIEHRDTLEAAFISGAVVVASGVVAFSIARRAALRIHLPPLYRQCLRRLRSDEQVKQLIGRRVMAGPQAARAAAAAAPPSQPASSNAAVASLPSPPSSAPSDSAPLSSSVSVSGFRVINCLPPGPRWRRVPGVAYWYHRPHSLLRCAKQHCATRACVSCLVPTPSAAVSACCVCVCFRGWERYWRPRRAQFVVSISGECGSGVMLAQVDSKLNDQRRLAWLSVESIQSHTPAATHSLSRRLVLEDDRGGWVQDMERSSKRAPV